MGRAMACRGCGLVRQLGELGVKCSGDESVRAGHSWYRVSVANNIAILTEQTDTTDLTVTTEFGGPFDHLPTALDVDIIAVLRESVSNTVHHARASTITVKLALLENVVTLEVTDNGVGIGHPIRSSGLSNMRRRAENHGGALRHSTPPGGVTRLTWTAHHPHPDAPNEAA